MTRKIEQAMVAAIRAGQPFKSGNTEVVQGDGITEVRLHGNVIARHAALGWYWTLAGWNTATTRSRINALARAFGWSSRPFQASGLPHATLGGGGFKVIDDREWVSAI